MTENKAKNDEKNDDIKKYKEDAKKNIALFRWSLFINLVLVVIVIVFFVITATSKNPNIINYENVLIDKYSSWDQELTERERAVKEKEAELNITYGD
jgi:signal peptidase I